MDPNKNPFSPGAGTPPPELAGREAIISQSNVLLARVMAGRSEKSLMMVGLRGVGKTVLLNFLKTLAEKNGYRTLIVEAHDEKPLAALLAPGLRQTLLGIDRLAAAGDKAKRGLRILKGFLGGLKISVAGLEIGIDAEAGMADSGDIEADLPELLSAVAEAAQERGTAVAIFIDEIQYLHERELSALIMSMHRIAQSGLPLVLIGAGLPQLLALAGDSKSYAERLFDFPAIGPLNTVDATRALVEPIKKAGAAITPEAVQAILNITEGYPYFLQEWGYHTWNLAPETEITAAVVAAATAKATLGLDQAFFRVRFDRLTSREKEYMRALAELGAGRHKTGAIAAILKTKPQALAVTRDSLIKKGMIYSPAYGEAGFTVPLFDRFMHRVMPDKPKPWNKAD